MSYCIYLRKSRADAQAELAGEGETLARHEKTLLSLAEKQKIPIAMIYREIVSGETIAARPVMQQLLQEVEAGLWTGVLVMEVERLGRGDTMEQGLILNAFKYSGTKIITPTKTYDPNNEFDEEYFEFSQFMSRREYKTILRRMQRGRESSAREGKFAGSVAPFGYRRVKLPREKGFTLEIEPEEAAIVRLVYELYAYGDPQPDGSSADIGRTTIAKRLAAMGAKNRKGSAWATTSVTRMLQNPVYAGKMHWNRRPQRKTTENGKIKITRPLCEDYILADGMHEAIVSDELWHAAQEKMQRHSRPTGYAGTTQNPLAGLVRCSYCGRTMQRRPYRKSGQPASLICTTHFCPQVSSALDLVENRILEGLSLWIAHREVAWEAIAAPADALAGKIRTLQNLIEARERELEGLQAQYQNTFDLLERGIYSDEIFTERNKALSERLCTMTDALDENRAELQQLRQAQEKQRTLLPKASSLLETYRSLDPAGQNRLLKELLHHVEYHKKGGGRWHNAPDEFSLTIYPAISRGF